MTNVVTKNQDPRVCYFCDSQARVSLRLPSADGNIASIRLCQKHYSSSTRFTKDVTIGRHLTFEEFLLITESRPKLFAENKSLEVPRIYATWIPGWLFDDSPNAFWDNRIVSLYEFKLFELWYKQCEFQRASSQMRVLMQQEFEHTFLAIRPKSHEVFKSYLLSTKVEHTQNVPGSALNEPEEADLSKPTTLNSW